MCCPFLLIAFFGPRITLVFLWLTNYLAGAFQTALWPLIGFFIMPYTTLAYAVAMHNGGVVGIWVILVIVAAIADLGVHGGGAHSQRRRFAD